MDHLFSLGCNFNGNMFHFLPFKRGRNTLTLHSLLNRWRKNQRPEPTVDICKDKRWVVILHCSLCTSQDQFGFFLFVCFLLFFFQDYISMLFGYSQLLHWLFFSFVCCYKQRANISYFCVFYLIFPQCSF